MAESSITIPNPYNAKSPFICVSLSAVIKLIPSTYIPWQLQCEAILEGYDLFCYPAGSLAAPPLTITKDGVASPNPAYQEWKRQDKLVYGALLTTLSPTVASLVTQTKTSIELWTLLKNTYAKASRGHVKQLKDRIRSSTMGSLSVTEYMHGIKGTADLLATIGHPISTEDITDYILRGLDDGYKPIIDAVNARDSAISFEDLLEKLINHELRLAADVKHTTNTFTWPK